MLRFFNRPRWVGEPVSRREWLRIGGLAGIELALAGKRAANSPAAPAGDFVIPGFGRAKSVILVYTSGGQSQLETWDPKPDAPAEIRGEFKGDLHGRPRHGHWREHFCPAWRGLRTGMQSCAASRTTTSIMVQPAMWH